MLSNEFLLGELITQRREKNPGGNLPIRGVSKDGLQPPKQIDADTSVYNLYYRNDFVYNPARMELGSIAFNDEYDKAICSSLYEVFFVHRTDVLIPEYLALFVRKPEFARYCNYIGNGSAREYCRFDNISVIPITLPTIEEQRRIVHDYRVVTERIALLRRLNANLSAQRDALFYEFYPDEKNLPDGWSLVSLSSLGSLITDYVANGSFESLSENVQYLEYDTGNVLIRLTDFNNDYSGKFVFVSDSAYDFLSKSTLYGGEIIISNIGVNVGTTFRCPQLPYRMSLAPNSIMIRDDSIQEYLYAFFVSDKGQHAIQEIVTGSAQPKFNKTGLRTIKIAVPNDISSLDSINFELQKIYKLQCKTESEIRCLNNLRKVLLDAIN